VRGLAFLSLFAAGALALPAVAVAQSDLSPPETLIIQAPANPTGDREATFSFTGHDDTTPPDELEFECRLDITDAQDPLGEQWVECLSPQFFSGLMTGQHTFEVRALDAEENIDPTPARHTWTILPPQNCAESGGTVPAVADSWISESSPIDVKGDDSSLKVQSKGPGDNMRAAVRFGLPMAPAGCFVASARMRLYAGSASPFPRTLEAYRLASAWGEHNISWSNQPQTAGGPAHAASGLGYVEWDVTGQVQGMYSAGNHGFLVRDAGEYDIDGAEQQFNSREKLETMPELAVTFGGRAVGGGGDEGGRGSRGSRAARAQAALRRALRMAARRLRRLGIAGLLRRDGVRVGVGVPTRGTVRIGAVGGSRRRVVVLRGARRFASAGRGVLRLKLTGRGRRLIAPRRSVRLALTAGFNGRAGISASAGLRVRVTRHGRR
jgi:hypothetical protein